MTQGELTVALHEARNLPVWGFYGQSNPYCRLTLGTQAVRSRSEDDTSHKGKHGAPVWNQEFQFLVEDAETQVWTSVGVGVGQHKKKGVTGTSCRCGYLQGGVAWRSSSNPVG